VMLQLEMQIFYAPIVFEKVVLLLEQVKVWSMTRREECTDVGESP
jgi:hypothetical protein